jgi:hypothetical protein
MMTSGFTASKEGLILDLAQNNLIERTHRGAESIDQLAFFVQQVFLKIPFDFRIHDPVFTFVGQPMVQRVNFRAFDVDFGCHGETYPVTHFTKMGDASIRAGLLPAKIIGGQPHDD